MAAACFHLVEEAIQRPTNSNAWNKGWNHPSRFSYFCQQEMMLSLIPLLMKHFTFQTLIGVSAEFEAKFPSHPSLAFKDAVAAHLTGGIWDGEI